MKKNRTKTTKPSHSALDAKEQFRMLPGHLIVGIWCVFTIGMLLWIVAFVAMCVINLFGGT